MPRGGFRDTIAAFVHYNDDGTIAPVTIDARGVGPRNLSAIPVVNAENFHLFSGPGSKGHPHICPPTCPLDLPHQHNFSAPPIPTS